jgi:hypothetical protein
MDEKEIEKDIINRFYKGEIEIKYVDKMNNEHRPVDIIDENSVNITVYNNRMEPDTLYIFDFLDVKMGVIKSYNESVHLFQLREPPLYAG